MIGPASGYQSPGAGYVDLGPTFGNWTASEHGFLGLTINDAADGGVYYAYAEIDVNSDYSITLDSFAYNDVKNGTITTVLTPVPEPSTLAVLGFGAAAMLLRKRVA